jgi:hypothetical protein
VSQEECPTGVEVHQRVPVIHCVVFEREVDFDGSIVDYNVYAAKVLDSRLR